MALLEDRLKTWQSLFEQTLSPSQQLVASAEAELKNMVGSHRTTEPRTSVFEELLRLQLCLGVSEEARMAAAIFFKNLVKQQWESPPASGNGISDEDKMFIRQHIVTLLMSVPYQADVESSDIQVPLSCSTVIPSVRYQRRIQLQFSEALFAIAVNEFPGTWTALLPDLLKFVQEEPYVANAREYLHSSMASPGANPTKWMESCKLATKDMMKKVTIFGVMSTLLEKYKGPEATLDNETIIELKTILEQFCGPLLMNLQFCWTQLLTINSPNIPENSRIVRNIRHAGNSYASLDDILTPKSQPIIPGTSKAIDTNLDHYFYSCTQCILNIFKCIHSLNALDVPEFFENNLSHFMEVFLGAADWTIDSDYFERFDKIEKPIRDVKNGGIVECLKAQIIDILTLYADRYQEDLDPYVARCFESAWRMVLKVDCSERNDTLVVSCMKFFSSMAQTAYTFSEGKTNPFADKAILDELCRKVILPNVYLRDDDILCIDENPQEFIRKDMEGSDQDSRRWSAISLIKSVVRLNSTQLSEVLLEFVRHLCQTPTSDALQCARMKDTCTALVIGLHRSTSGPHLSTSQVGGSLANTSVSAQFAHKFFVDQLLPELQKEQGHILCIAAALKFATIFRHNVSVDTLGAILSLSGKHLQNEDAVVHTYAANCVEKIIKVRQSIDVTQVPVTASANAPAVAARAKPKLDPSASMPILLQCMNTILHLLESKRGMEENEYLARCMLRITQFLGKEAGDVAMPFLERIVNIVKAAAHNPTNPMYSHYIFEALAILCRISANRNCQSQAENFLLPVLSYIIQQELHEFAPYCFQILGLLLDLSKNPQTNTLYTELFHYLMRQDCWAQSKANVPGLVRLIAAYLRQASSFKQVLTDNITTLFERCQWCLNHPILSHTGAFPLLKAVVRYLPFNFYEKEFKTLLTVILAKVNRSNTTKVRQDVTEFFAMCICIINNGPNIVVQTIESIQSGLTPTVFNLVFLRSVSTIVDSTDQKLVALALAKLIASEAYKKHAELILPTIKALASLLKSANSQFGCVQTNPEDATESALFKEDEYDATYSLLVGTEVVPKDALQGVNDVKNQIKDSLRCVAHIVKQEASNDLTIDHLDKLMA